MSCLSNQGKIVIFGAGNYGKLALEYYGEDAVECFCDNNQKMVGQIYCSKKVISFEELQKIYPNCQIILAVERHYSILNQFLKNGIEHYELFLPRNRIEYNEAEFDKEVKLRPIEVEITLNKMQTNYIKNTKLLYNYPYLFGKIPDFNFFKDRTLNLDEEVPYFFQDLSKPLFIRNLSHPTHIKFLFDNVRASEDVAMDNHIYLYYTNERKFLEMLYQCDLKPLLKKQKFIFLLGKHNKDIYPINFKKKYGIDYSSMPFKSLRANELKRIVLYRGAGYSGQDFLFQICAANKNILPIAIRGPFSYLPKLKQEILKSKVHIKDLFVCFDIFEEDHYSLSNPDIFRFISTILYNNREELVKHGEKNRARISPTIILDPHIAYNYKLFYDVYKSFPYRRGTGIIRNPIMRFISIIQALKGLYSSKFSFSPLYSLSPLFFGEQNNYKCFKLESLKENPVKGAKALCKYFQVPFDKNMLHPEYFSYIKASSSVTGKKVTGFEPTPKRDIQEFLSERDLQRLMPIFEPILKYYGYECKNMNTEMFAALSEDDLRKIYSEPFLFEKKYKINDRDYITEVMLYVHNLIKSNKCYLPPFIDIE